jgi:hypothetical protein
MATIASTTNALRHVRKTIAFDGSAGNGAAGTVTVFTITGRVLAELLPPAFCSENLTESGATAVMSFGTASAPEGFFGDTNAVDVDTGEWWSGWGTSSLGFESGTAPHVALSENLILTISGANITDGTLVIDLWYYPITDDGALAGDDIDAGYMPADVKAWLATAPATPTVAGVPEVDVTHFGGTALTAAAGIPEVKVASIAAAAVTAAAIATDAIDADALAADALTEIFTKVLTTALTESYNADGAAPTLAQAIFLLIGALTEFAISGTTLTVKKLDGTTTAATYTLNSATAPTSRTRAT